MPNAEKDAPTVQEGIRCSHGVQGPYQTAGEPIANCGERGVVVRRLLYADQTFTDWLELSAADLTRVFPPAEFPFPSREHAERLVREHHQTRDD